MADIRPKAVATANEYNQGDIATLDDAMTRRLIASVVLTESRGGDLDMTNRLGYVGRYQAGAQWLADAGYVNKEKLGEAMSGHRSEWAWASSGGVPGDMSKFLENPGNWNKGLSLEQYKQSPELQDKAFKINAERAYGKALGEGVLSENDKQEKIAGFLKAEHIAGYGAAKAAVTGGRATRDGNGVSNYDLMHDITRDRDGLGKHMTQSSPDQSIAASDKTHAPAVLLSHPDHQDHDRYKRVYELLDKVGGFSSVVAQQNAAGVIAHQSKDIGMSQVHAIFENKKSELFPTQDPGMAHERTFKVERAHIELHPIAESTKQIDTLNLRLAQLPENPQQSRNMTV